MMKSGQKWKASLAGALLLSSIDAFAASLCSLESPGANFIADYTSAVDRQQYLYLVEMAHFTASVRNLTRGSSGERPAPDINYTLNHFPNHHGALDAVSRLSVKEKNPKPVGMRCSVDGWFERAIDYKPEDAMVHMTYGMHFYRIKKIDKAVEQFEKAEKLAPDNINLLYNLGLIYFDLKQYDKAMAYAEKAYQGDFPLAGLKQKLMKAGKWVEPKPVPKQEESKEEPVKPAEPNASNSSPNGAQ